MLCTLGDCWHFLSLFHTVVEMNSPLSFRLDSLTPSSSPIQLSLDNDYLLSPNKFKLSDSFYPNLGKINNNTSSTTNFTKSIENNKPTSLGFSFFNNGNSGPSNTTRSILFKNDFLNGSKKNNGNKSADVDNNVNRNFKNSNPLLSTLLNFSSSKSTAKNSNATDAKASNTNGRDLKETIDIIQQLQKGQKLSNTQSNNTTKTNDKAGSIPGNSVNDNSTMQKMHPGVDTLRTFKSNSITTTVTDNNVTENQDSRSNNHNYSGKVSTPSPNISRDHLGSPTVLRETVASPIEFNIPAKNIDNHSSKFSNNDIHFENDRNGFVKYIINDNSNNGSMIRNNGKNIKQRNVSNRYSFISSTSTDYDSNEYIDSTKFNGNLHHYSQQYPSHSNPITNSQQPADIPNQLPNAHTDEVMADYSNRLESSKLDLKIKQLEVEINELKLQNAKLVNSINTNKLIEDKLIIEYLQNKNALIDDGHDSKYASLCNNTRKAKHSKKNSKNKEVKSKLQYLEKQFNTYKDTLNKLEGKHLQLQTAQIQHDNNQYFHNIFSSSSHHSTDHNITNEDSISRGKSRLSYKHPHHTSHSDYKRQVSTATSVSSTNRHSRISRISTNELKKLEETTDPSSSFSSIYSDNDDYSDNENGNLELVNVLQDQELNTDAHHDVPNGHKSGRIPEMEYEADIEPELDIPKRKGFCLNLSIDK